MSLPRFFHKRGAHLRGGRGGSMDLCIFVLVSPVKEENNDLPQKPAE